MHKISRKKVIIIRTILIALLACLLAGAAYAESNEGFYMSKIDDEIFARIKDKSFKDNCTLPVEDLRYIHVLHKDL